MRSTTQSRARSRVGQRPLLCERAAAPGVGQAQADCAPRARDAEGPNEGAIRQHHAAGVDVTHPAEAGYRQQPTAVRSGRGGAVAYEDERLHDSVIHFRRGAGSFPLLRFSKSSCQANVS